MIDPNILKRELSKFWDEDLSEFQAYPESFNMFADKFSNALNLYLTSLVPISTTLSAACSSFSSRLKLTQSLDNGSLESALNLFLDVLISGMLPLYICAPIYLTSLEDIWMLGIEGDTSINILNKLCARIDMWIKSQVAIETTTQKTIVFS